MFLQYHKEIPFCAMPGVAASNQFMDEKLVDLKAYFSDEILTQPMYYKKGIRGATQRCFVRLSVAKKLEQAMELLSDRFCFCVFDAWRPLEVQQELYSYYYQTVRESHKDWNSEQIEQETVKFVSKPVLDAENPAVHTTGGAIDLTIVDKDSGEALDMGTKFDDFTQLSYTDFFEKTNQEEVKKNRRLLYWTMLQSGFTNLPSEWWHYDYGDKFWSYYTKKPALYCGITKGESLL